jgi:hypothetical protein
MPPDLSKPYVTEEDRARDREALLFYEMLIEAITRLADRPDSSWSEDQRSLFPGSVPGGPAEHPLSRLQRWITIYGDEIKIIRDVRNRIVHSGIVADPEIRGAAWLARQIISTLFDLQPSQVNPIWARQVAAKAARDIE